MERTFSMRFLKIMFESIPFVILGMLIGFGILNNFVYIIIFIGYVIICNLIVGLLEINYEMSKIKRKKKTHNENERK